MKKISWTENSNFYDIFLGSNEEILAKREEILNHDYMGEITYRMGEPKFTPNKKYCLVLEDNEIFGVSLYVKSLVEMARIIEESTFAEGYFDEVNPLWDLISSEEKNSIRSILDRITHTIESYNSAIEASLYNDNEASRDMAMANLPYLLQNCYIAMDSITGLSWDWAGVQSGEYCQIKYRSYGEWRTPLPEEDE